MRVTLPFWVSLLVMMPLGIRAQTPLLEKSQDEPQVATADMRKQESAFKQLTVAAAAKAAAACTNTTSLNFAQRPLNEDWKNHTPVNAGAANTNTTISTAGSYVEPVGGTQTNLVVSTNGGALNRQPLFWGADYISSQNATTQITFSFNRPVNNFSLQIQDIDFGAASWIDVVTFTAVQANGVVLNLSAPSDASVVHNTTYNTLNGNKITGILNNVPKSENATVVVTFNKPIVSFQITYQNTINQADPGGQYIGIDYMTWCTQANVATMLNGPVRAIVGTQVTYTATTTASGDFAASGVNPRVQLSPGLNSQSPVFPTGSTYNNATGLLTLAVVPLLAAGTSSISDIKFNMPASTVTGSASSTIDTDDADPSDNNGSLANARVTTTTNAAPTAAAKMASVTANTAVFSALPAMTGTDPNNDVLTYTIVGSSIANINFGTVYYTRAGVQTALAGTSNVTLTAAEAMTLAFKNTNGVISNNLTFSYFVSDPYGGVSSNANYTITIDSQPAVYTAPNIFVRTKLVDNHILASVTDPDGVITTASVVQTVGATEPRIIFNTTTGQFTANIGNGKDQQPAVGTYTFSVTTSGTSAGVSVTSVTITILASDTPAVYSTGNTYNRDALATGSSLATVTDADGPLKSATFTGPAATGIAFNTTTGQFTVNSVTVPYVGTYTYNVSTVDAAGGTTATSATMTIRDDVEAMYTSAAAQPGAYANGYSLATVTDADGSTTSAVLSTSTLPDGVGLNSITGQLIVIDRTLLRPGTYIIQIRTTDITGGVTLQDVTINIGARPLPVALVSFTAQTVGSDAKLVWRTASEKNNDYLDVERSFSGSGFEKISQLKGQGNASAPTDYVLTDAGVGTKATAVYYRLKQVDTDGAATYSPVRTVAFPKALAPSFGLYPNPAAANTRLDLTQLSAGTYQMSVTDAMGRVVRGASLTAGLVHVLELNSLASGTYVVLVHGQYNGQVVRLAKRLVKE